MTVVQNEKSKWEKVGIFQKAKPLLKKPVLFGILMPICFGRLAQLVRALPSHGRGRGFESPIAHHLKVRFT